MPFKATEARRRLEVSYQTPSADLFLCKVMLEWSPDTSLLKLQRGDVMDANIQEFLDYLIAEKGSSDNTIAAYRNDLTQFHAFVSQPGQLDKEGIWEDLTRDHLINYILYLKEREYASAT